MFRRAVFFLFIVVGNVTFSNAQLYLEDETRQVDSTASYTQTVFEGKIIREIFIVNETFSRPAVQDSADTSTRSIQLGRYFHINTRSFVIRKLLLFNTKDRIDSLRIKESERLIRAQRYIDRGSIEVVPIAGCADSVDIRVLVRDAFGLVPEGQLSTSRFGVGLKAINLLGWGHQIRGFYTWNRDVELNNYTYSYDIPSIANTFVNFNVLYHSNLIDTTSAKRLSFQRPFYSFFTHWAGGVTLMQESQQSNVFLPGVVDPVLQRLQYDEQDYWAAYALRLMREENQRLVLSVRYYRIDYTEKPLPEFDPLRIYTEENLYLLGVGFSERKYKQERYLLRFGYIEDIPVGQAYNIIGGIQNKNGLNRLYLGTSLSRGQYIQWGYIEMLIQLGAFFNNASVQEGVFRSELNYFSPLIEINGWKIRHFFRPRLLLGINRLATDRITLNDYFDIRGFNSIRPFGTHKMVGHLRTSVYTPYAPWGFKIGGYLSYSMGMLGDDKSRFFSGVYSSFGLGLMFRNDRLGFSFFSVGLSYFPYVPDEGYHIFNLYESKKFNHHDFDINKPNIIRYR